MITTTPWTVTFDMLLVALALCAYLATDWPGKRDDQRQARTAQLAAGAYLVLSAGFAGAVVAASSAGAADWLKGDDLARPATPVLLALLALLGARLLLHGTQKLAESSLRLGCLAALPMTILGVFDALVLSYLLAGHGGTGIERQAATVSTILTAGVTAVLLTTWCRHVLRHPRLWSDVTRGALTAAGAALVETALLAARATGHFGYRDAGVDLLYGGLLLGIGVFAVTLVTDGVAIQAPGLARRPARQGPRMQAPSTARPYPLNPVSADASSASDEMAA